jgi:hypothetical protein
LDKSCAKAKRVQASERNLKDRVLAQLARTTARSVRPLFTLIVQGRCHGAWGRLTWARIGSSTWVLVASARPQRPAVSPLRSNQRSRHKRKSKRHNPQSREPRRPLRRNRNPTRRPARPRARSPARIIVTNATITRSSKAAPSRRQRPTLSPRQVPAPARSSTRRPDIERRPLPARAQAGSVLSRRPIALFMRQRLTFRD